MSKPTKNQLPAGVVPGSVIQSNGWTIWIVDSSLPLANNSNNAILVQNHSGLLKRYVLVLSRDIDMDVVDRKLTTNSPAIAISFDTLQEALSAWKKAVSLRALRTEHTHLNALMKRAK